MKLKESVKPSIKYPPSVRLAGIRTSLFLLSGIHSITIVTFGVQLVDPDDRFSAVDARAVNPSPQTAWSFLVFSSPAALRPSS
uniref:Uncharacterized protein n=1 Tax=Timema douglasi TaxID=61478 RepID=A0A7R8ZDT4_TIMDO|nr:unnamed protein product [Timema douglasi]